MLVLNKNMPVVDELKDDIYIKLKDTKFSSNEKSKKILILNLMPNKVETEYHLLRLLQENDSSSSIEPFFLKLSTHNYKNIDNKYLDEFYVTLEDLKKIEIDAAIITGAPLEKIEFEEVTYWNELKKIFEFIDNLKSTIFICWGSQAALHYFHGIKKYEYSKKKFGIFQHKCEAITDLFNNISESDLKIPHSRYTYIKREEVENTRELKILLSDEENEPVIVRERNKIYISGHMEYAKYNLRDEYIRDIKKGIVIEKPENYFLENDINKEPVFSWDSFSREFYKNWLGSI